MIYDDDMNIASEKLVLLQLVPDRTHVREAEPEGDRTDPPANPREMLTNGKRAY